ncbi:MAG: acyltransferase [Atopobiaceae bacterium]|nr:acyltransferase [Atopobiaceae bacterium]
MPERKVIHYFQWLRALGAVAIVLLHAVITIQVVQLPMPEAMGLANGLMTITLTRWAVPVFFMMSGALMLDPAREMGWAKTLRHVWRLGFVLLTFGFVFCLAEVYVNDGGLSARGVGEAVLRLVGQRSWDHMWFVYQLLGFYLVTPIIRPWVAQASRSELGRVTLVTCILLLGFKALSRLTGSYNVFYGFEVPHCFAYYLLGYYVHAYLELDRRWVALGVASLVATVVLWHPLGCLWATDPNRGVVAPYSVLVMLLAKRYLERPVEAHWPVGLLADYSFGIYLVHPALQHLMVMVPAFVALPVALVEVLLTVVPLVLSVPIVWALRHLPGFADKV